MGQEIKDINGGAVKSPLDGTERIEIQEAAGGAGSTKQTTTQDIANLGGGTWGSITGTLSDQTDLTTALGLKAPLASPTFTGTPAGPTAANGTNTTQLASTAFVQAVAGTVLGAQKLYLFNNFI